MTRVRLASSPFHASRHQRPRFRAYAATVLGSGFFFAFGFLTDDVLHVLIAISMALSFLLLGLTAITRAESHARGHIRLRLDGPLTFTPTVAIGLVWIICAANFAVTSVCITLTWITPGADPFGSHSRQGIFTVPVFFLGALFFVVWSLARVVRTVGVRIDERGITRTTAFTRSRTLWLDVQGVSVTGGFAGSRPSTCTRTSERCSTSMPSISIRTPSSWLQRSSTSAPTPRSGTRRTIR